MAPAAQAESPHGKKSPRCDHRREEWRQTRRKKIAMDSGMTARMK